VDLPLLESILRGLGFALARVAFGPGVLTKTNRMLWQFTSNAALFPPDLINRSLITSHRKQPEGYEGKSSLGWGEVEPFKNIETHRARLLGAIYAVISEYIRRGKHRTTERRHDFRDYIQSVDWIVTELLGLRPLLEGHADEQKILGDKAMGWLREVCIALEKEEKLGSEEWIASKIKEFCDEAGIEIPGLPRASLLESQTDKNQNQHLGRLFSKLFKKIPSIGSHQIPLSDGTLRTILDERSLSIGSVTVRRLEIKETDDRHPTKIYYFEANVSEPEVPK
jgi:hypothetical protein